MSGNGSKGGVHHGTKGNRQLTFDNESVRDANQIAKELQKYGDKSKWPNNLTRAMLKRLKTADNIIKDHCKSKDLSAIKIESAGGKIHKVNGETFNHLLEAENSLSGLDNAINSISKSLKNPKLKPKTRKFLKNKLKQYEFVREKLIEAKEKK